MRSNIILKFMDSKLMSRQELSAKPSSVSGQGNFCSRHFMNCTVALIHKEQCDSEDNDCYRYIYHHGTVGFISLSSY